jgi:dihydrofolate synthase/folylpolyglutamate synthase
MKFNSYESTIAFLYETLPVFHHIGSAAYRKDIHNTVALCKSLGNPELKFKSIHVAGTNGKGSSSHMLASILQQAGYRTGLYTSPHLKDFTERIRINGTKIDRQYVVAFVNESMDLIQVVKPSFFELTVAMCFQYFADNHVDIAVIETGLGGRLDSTNVVTPVVSLITNIGYDHQDILGNTLEMIAREKAGIIKRHIPSVIAQRQVEIQEVFLDRAMEMDSIIHFADDVYRAELNNDQLAIYFKSIKVHDVNRFPLTGIYQELNIPGVMMCVDQLRQQGFNISDLAVREGLANVISTTGLKGRWQVLGERPRIVCDTGHNEDGFRQILRQVAREKFSQLHIVLGMVKEKDISTILALLPRSATYYFCAAKIPRALPAYELSVKAQEAGLEGSVFEDVNAGIAAAKARASADDLIFVGGSTFVVAEIDSL